MKLKELFNEEVSNHTIKLNYHYGCFPKESIKLRQNEKQIVSEIESKLSGCKCIIKAQLDFFNITLSVLESFTDSMPSFISTINLVLTDFLDMDKAELHENESQCELQFRGVFPSLPKKINFPNICIKTTGIPSTLAGISKIIGECEKLEVADCRAISGNVLGLIPLSKNMKIVLTYGNRCQWSIIVEKHLRGDRDLLDCKEELMTEGLKEYAKL
jgi:hypothetical protein